MSDEQSFDEWARAVGRIMGPSLDRQLTNSEYLDSRGRGISEATALLRRAVELRDDELATPSAVAKPDTQAESGDGQ